MTEHKISDIHMHCIWGYDDGSRDREMTRRLLRQAFDQGVRRIACTSHGNVYTGSQEHYNIQFAKLKQLVEEAFPDLQVCTGTEIKVYPGDEERTAEMLADGRLHFLGNTRKAMIELSVHASLEDNLSVAERLMSLGVQAVIAHAERYHHFAESLADIEQLVRQGCQIQVNAYSLALEHNFSILQNARELVKHQLVHYIGSDAHRTDHRPPMYTEGINWIYENVSQEYADQIVFSNAEEFF